jgi:molybdenum cofactor guanylyltransferase
MTQPITTIVLAGGQSTRMGQDKALIAIANQPLLKSITEIAAQVSHEVLITTSWPERYQNIVAPSCRFVVDRINQGPLVAFAQTLPSVTTDWVLLLSCDLPNINAGVIQTWTQNLPAQAIAYLPQSEKGWEPLCGFYQRHCQDALAEFVAAGGRSFQQWLVDQRVEVLVVSDRDILFNCNTPDDLESLTSNSKFNWRCRPTGN